MRIYLFIAFLGLWVALFPFLPIEPGHTENAVLIVTGLLIAALAAWSLRTTLPS